MQRSLLRRRYRGLVPGTDPPPPHGGARGARGKPPPTSRRPPPAAPHPLYSASTSTEYAVSIALRLSFSDGVSSPCSSVNWWASIRNVRIDSACETSVLAATTARRISVSRSG